MVNFDILKVGLEVEFINDQTKNSIQTGVVKYKGAINGKEGDWVGVASRAGDTVLRATLTGRVQPGVVYTTFHFPESGANVITTDNSDWATNCPEYKVTAVEVVLVSQPSAWQERHRRFSKRQLDLLPGSAAAVEP